MSVRAGFRLGLREMVPVAQPGDLVPAALLPGQPSLGCPLCGDPVKDEGFFWQGSETIQTEDSYKGFPVVSVTEVFHPGCLHPEVIVVTRPHDGKHTPNMEIGRLRGFERGRDGWWLILDDTVGGYKSAAINWDCIEWIEKRYDPTTVQSPRRR